MYSLQDKIRVLLIYKLYRKRTGLSMYTVQDKQWFIYVHCTGQGLVYSMYTVQDKIIVLSMYTVQDKIMGLSM